MDKLKKQIPEISEETKSLLELFKDDSLRGLNNSELKDFFECLNGADDNFMSFIDKVDPSGDIMKQYKQHLIDTGKATSMFSGFTQKATSVLKSFGATLVSIGINWAIGEIISLVAKGFDNLVHKVEKANEAMSR